MKIKKKIKFKKIDIIDDDNIFKEKFFSFVKRNEIYKSFKNDYKLEFSNFWNQFRKNFNLLLFKKNNDEWFFYIIKLLFLFHFFKYLYDNILIYYRLYVNYIFDFFISIFKIFVIRYRILYSPKLTYDLKLLRRAFLLENFIVKFKFIFYVKKYYRFNDLVIKEKFFFRIFIIMLNLITFFIYRLPIIFSILIVILKFIIIVILFYIEKVYCLIIEKIFKFIMDFYTNYIFKIFFFKFRFNLKMTRYFKYNVELFFLDKDMEQIIKIIKNNNIEESNFINKFFRDIFYNIDKFNFTFEKINYKNFKKRIKFQKRILFRLKINYIKLWFEYFFFYFVYILKYFNFIFSIIKYILFVIKWIFLFIISLFTKRF